MVLLRVRARWSVVWVWALLVSSCPLSARSHEQEYQGHQPQETGGQEHQDHQPHETGGHQAHHGLDRNMVQDKDHILEHLEGVINKPESDMSNQELQLHYFKMHDYDGNNLLDGLELATAISHVHKEEGGEHSEPMKEEDLISLIDDVLRDDDKNNDGYIDYAEFAKSLG